MPERGSIISVNETKIMGGKFGRSNIFATHSLTHSLTISLKQQRESDGPGEGAARANQGDWSRDSFPEESWPCPPDFRAITRTNNYQIKSL